MKIEYKTRVCPPASTSAQRTSQTTLTTPHRTKYNHTARNRLQNRRVPAVAMASSPGGRRKRWALVKEISLAWVCEKMWGWGTE